MDDGRLMLVDWVLEHWHKGSLLEAVDARLGGDYDADEGILALKLGLMCSHPLPGARPSMRQVMEYLQGEMPLPEVTPTQMSSSLLALMMQRVKGLTRSSCRNHRRRVQSLASPEGDEH